MGEPLNILCISDANYDPEIGCSWYSFDHDMERISEKFNQNMLRIRKEDGTDESIRYKVFDLKNTPAIVWGTPQMPFYFVRSKDLNAKE